MLWCGGCYMVWESKMSECCLFLHFSLFCWYFSSLIHWFNWFINSERSGMICMSLNSLYEPWSSLALTTVTGSLLLLSGQYHCTQLPEFPHSGLRVLRSANEWQPVLLSLWGRKSSSKLFSCIVPWWWNMLPNSIWSAESLSVFKITWKPISSESTYPSNIIFLFLSIFLYLLHAPASLWHLWKSDLRVEALILKGFFLIYCDLDRSSFVHHFGQNLPNN